MDSSKRHGAVLTLLTAFLLFVGAAVPVRAQSAPAASKQLTVERIYSEPSLSGALTTGIEWSPDGARLGFFRMGEGPGARKELWTMDAATGDRRVLVNAELLESLLEPPKRPPTQATGLARRTPQSYFWAPDGNALLFASNGELVWLDLRNMKSRHLVSEESGVADPKISPDGRWVSYIEDHNLWVVGVGGGAPRQLSRGGNGDFLEGELDWVYPEELESATAYWWSPDSRQIAYLEMDERSVTKVPLVNYLSYTGETRFEDYPKAGTANPVVRVGVVGASGGKTQWISIGSDNDVYLPRVNWLPDGRRLAIQRLNRAQNRLDLWLADASGGVSTVILTETDPYWINVSDDLYFFSDGTRFLWSSERSGPRHLYLYDVSGNLLEQLTRGDWQVASLAGVDEKNGFVYFSATEKSPGESHLYRVSLADKSADRVTRNPGWHEIEMAPSAGYYVDTYSDAMTPPRQELFRSTGRRVATISENNVPELAQFHLAPVEFMDVSADDGTKLHAMMIQPADFDASRKYPVLVYVYGGPGVQLVRNAWESDKFLWDEMMAQKGYIIFTVDNRGAHGRGHAFETPIYHHLGKVELADQLAGVRYLKALPYVDGSRIGIWGWSYGGFMTLNAMFNAGDVFKAGFAGSPVTDWRQYDTIYTERYMGRPQDNPEGYRDSSPVNQAAKLTGKLLIATATGDDNVHFGNTIELIERLIGAEKYAEVLAYGGRGHGISDPPARKQLFERVTRFFLDNL
jgi:dipeptidyl-peptidase-4